MEFLTPFITVVHIIVCVFIVIAVLLQPGKGGDLGSIFGGSSQTIFGASGALPFLTKLTRLLGVIFIVTSLSLGYISIQGERSTVIKDEPAVSGSFGTEETTP